MGGIFAIERNGVVCVGGDTTRQYGHIKLYANGEYNRRIKVFPSGIIVAATGNINAIQRMLLHDEWFELAEGEKFDKRFIVTKIVPRFYEAVETLHPWKPCEDELCEELEAGFIFVKDTDIYLMFGDLSVIKCNKMAAISEGFADIMMVTYANSSKEEDPERLVKKAFETVAKHNKCVSAYGEMVNNKDFTFKRMEDIR